MDSFAVLRSPEGSALRCTRRQAVTLVEILVAVAMLGVLFIPVFDLFRSGAATAQYTEDRLRAFLIAQQQVETIKHACQVDKYAMEKLVGEYFSNGNPRKFRVEDRYDVTLFVDPSFPVEAEGRKALVCFVRVDVDWILSGEPRHVELEALVDRAYR